MDFDDDQFDRAEKVNSNTRLYQQAGNSICVNCLTAIFGQLFEGKEDIYKDRQATHVRQQKWEAHEYQLACVYEV